MKNKILLIGLILSILGMIGFVSAEMVEKNNGNFNVSVSLSKGWNIIAGTEIKQGILSDSQIKLSDIKVIWYYSPVLKKYYQLYPNNQLEKVSAEDGRQLDEDVILTSAVWIYSAKAGVLRYDTLEDYPLLDDRKLYAGYNFFTVTPDIKGKSFDEIKGSCNIDKFFTWDVDGQQWSTSLPHAGIGMGMIIKVSNDCTLGIAEEISVPPQIPN